MIIVVVEVGSGGAGGDVGKLALVVGLDLQQGHDAFPQISVFVLAGAVLLGLGIEELTAVAVCRDLAENKVRTAFVPVKRRTEGKLRGVGTELQFAIGELDRHEFSVTVEQQSGGEFVFGFGKIGDSGHGVSHASVMPGLTRHPAY